MDELGTWVAIPREEPPMKNICVKIGDEGPDGSIIKNGVTFTYLQHGDCLEEMAKLPDGIVDMVLCDLPYGQSKLRWDSVIPFDPLWQQINRVSKENAAVALFGSEPFTSALIMSNPRQFRQKLTWLKTRPTNVFNAKRQFMNWTEDIAVFYRKSPTFHPQMRTDGKFTGEKRQHTHTDRSAGIFQQTGEREGYVHKGNGGLFYPKTVLEFSNVHHGSECYHPVQKPVALLEYLIRTYTNPGDLVLDMCMGSGSTGVAAVSTGRSFVGIEIDEGYYETAKKRIVERINGSWNVSNLDITTVSRGES